MKLFYAPGTISIAVAIALEETGMVYEPVKLSFANGEQLKPEYLAINPKGRVPALVIGGDRILTETGALLDYIAALNPDAGLVPASPETAAHMRSVMYYLASTMHVAHAHKMRGSRWADAQASFDDMTQKVPHTMRACAAFIEENAFLGDFVTGNDISIADFYLFIVCDWLEGDGVTVADFPSLDAYMQRMETRDSVKAMRAKGML